MKAYKGFNSDMTCRGFQYEEGKTYEEPTADLCKKGFHACEDPLDCIGYYHPADGAVYGEVELGGVSPQRGSDTKVCGTKIKIGAKIDLAQVIKGGVDFVFSKVYWEPTKNGDYATSAANGYSATSAANGKYAKSAANGDLAKSEVKGDESIAAAFGRNVQARASKGGWIVLSEIDENGHILDIKAFKVDDEEIKADTWYRLEGGKFVEVE